ncbi:enoyl-CoA hydratase/isomerase family protein [Nocardioides bruguierae]|uniref:Enoyl-CoA hydratase/isomerase family protein n=1 Tax=Nocardioides bruguierae TaxID=2945102 RepID=A0A9X2D4Z4_9ACTN|nr:enoyl-CoA hydratase/isomerase family protein [Nocardioides bruguierae]MCM0619308.1 enoyl-CoA hydratase/isomerase family protein [Nocardioides bruguierae]
MATPLPHTPDLPLTHLRLERHDDGVAVLTLDQPERRNAMSTEMTASWQAALAHLEGDDGLRAVLVTGAGSAFCSGGDTTWLASEPDASVDDLRTRMMGFYRAWLGVRRLEVPVVAAINGPAIGAGLALALACDVRVAAPGARMGVPFTALGLHPGMGTTHLLPDVVGHAAARDLLLTGRLVADDEALRLGLVTQVLDDGDFAASALALVRGIAATAPVAARLTKLALARGGHSDLEAALQWEGLAQPVTLATADLAEGLAAARERRRPRFTGR